jgi:DNA invertase Pin-like site-specific DNA recombinase
VNKGLLGANVKLRDARTRRFDVLVVRRLARLSRNLRDLTMLLDEMSALGLAAAGSA